MVLSFLLIFLEARVGLVAEQEPYERSPSLVFSDEDYRVTSSEQEEATVPIQDAMLSSRSSVQEWDDAVFASSEVGAQGGEPAQPEKEGSKSGSSEPGEDASVQDRSSDQTQVQSQVESREVPERNQVVEPQALTTAPPTAELVALHPLESSMLADLNRRRAEKGLSPVVVDPVLTSLARARSQDMATRNYFSHTAPDGSTYLSGLRDRGVVKGIVGEILGRNNASDEQSVPMVVEAFMKSPSHQVHVVYPTYQSVGVGAAKGEGDMKYFAIVFWGP